MTSVFRHPNPEVVRLLEDAARTEAELEACRFIIRELARYLRGEEGVTKADLLAYIFDLEVRVWTDPFP